MRTSSYVIKTSCSFPIAGSARSGGSIPHTALKGQLCRAVLSVFLGGQSQGTRVTWRNHLHWGPCCDGVQSAGQGLELFQSPAGSWDRGSTTVWGVNITRHVMWRDSSWDGSSGCLEIGCRTVPRARQCSLGWVAVPLLCLAVAVWQPLQLCCLGTVLVETSVTKVAGVLSVKENKDEHHYVSSEITGSYPHTTMEFTSPISRIITEFCPLGLMISKGTGSRTGCCNTH